METNVSRSNTNVFPRVNNVLVKMTFETSIFAVINGKYEGDNTTPAKFEIAGIGPLVKDLELGDNIIMKLEQYESVNVAGNERSITNLKKHYDTLPKSEVSALQGNKNTKNVTVIEYGIFPEFLIRAIKK